MTSRTLLALAALSLLAGCYQVGSLDGTQVEPITVEGRKFEVRLRPTDVSPNQWRLEINRSTIVVNPDLELESDRAREVAGTRGINYYTVFSCE
jgi:hypothetical protein